MPHKHRHENWHDRRALTHETMGLLAEIKEMDPTWDAQCDARLDAARAQFPAEEEPGDGQEGMTR